MITSTQNEQVKAWKKLKQRKYRKKTGTFLVEGFHLLEEAYKSGWRLEVILLREDTPLPNWAENITVEVLSEGVFKEITETKTPQGIAAVVNMQTKEAQLDGDMLLMDTIQDPGNLGTMIRTADALGFTAVYLSKGSVDIYNEKVLRASQGSIFHIPVREIALDECIEALKEANYTVWASTLDEAIPLQSANFSSNTALIVGNEGEGISQPLLDATDHKVKIPILGQAESFNVAVAAGIMMHEISNRA